MEDTKTLPNEDFKAAAAEAIKNLSEVAVPKKKSAPKKKAAEKVAVNIDVPKELTPAQRYWKSLGAPVAPRTFPPEYRFHLSKKDRKGKTPQQIQELRKELFNLSKM